MEQTINSEWSFGDELEKVGLPRPALERLHEIKKLKQVGKSAFSASEWKKMLSMINRLMEVFEETRKQAQRLGNSLGRLTIAGSIFVIDLLREHKREFVDFMNEFDVVGKNILKKLKPASEDSKDPPFRVIEEAVVGALQKTLLTVQRFARIDKHVGFGRDELTKGTRSLRAYETLAYLKLNFLDIIDRLPLKDKEKLGLRKLLSSSKSQKVRDKPRSKE